MHVQETFEFGIKSQALVLGSHEKHEASNGK